MSMEGATGAYEPGLESTDQVNGGNVFEIWDAGERAIFEEEKKQMGLVAELSEIQETSGTVYSLENPDVQKIQTAHEQEEARRRQRRIEARRHASIVVGAEVSTPPAREKGIRDPNFSIQPFARTMQRVARFMETDTIESAAV